MSRGLQLQLTFWEKFMVVIFNLIFLNRVILRLVGSFKRGGQIPDSTFRKNSLCSWWSMSRHENP
jgi:hypothetical protein